MENNPNSLISIYNDACRQFYNIKGLIISLAIPLVIISFIACFFLKFDNLNESKLSFLVNAIFYIILFFVSSIVIILVWSVKRSVPVIKKGKTGVLFGPSHSEATRKELDDLFEKVRREIESKDFSKTVSIKRLSPNIKVGSHSNNIEILRRSKAKVLISGNFENYTAKGRNITGFSSFTISAADLPTSPQHTPAILRDAIVGRQLGWTSENTIHKNFVVNNLSEIARFVVGLCLISDSEHEKAQLMIETLLIEFQQKYNNKRQSVEVIRFTNILKQSLVVSLVNFVIEEYRKELVSENIFNVNENTLLIWNKKLDKASKIDCNNSAIFHMLSIVRFLLNDVDGALISVRKARQCLPVQNQNLYDLSEAFLLCYKDNLNEARKVYKKLTKNPPTIQTINGVLSFLCQAIENYPDKYQIRFVYALLNDEFGDKSIALEEFEIFKIQTENNNFYQRWNREANLRIKKIVELLET